MPTAANPPDLAGILAAGNTPDVVLLQWTGKALPATLIPRYRQALQALQAVRGGVRMGDEAALMQWELAAPDDAEFATLRRALLQAARRELGTMARHDPLLFAGWSDFYNHARFAMVPLGRLMLHAAGVTSTPAAEALDASMTALALIGALQEAPQRYRATGTVALPWQWLANENVAASALGRAHCGVGLRQAYGRGIDRAHELLAIAGPARTLPGIGHWAAANNLLAQRLLRRLQRRDFLARPVALGLWDRLALRLKNF